MFGVKNFDMHDLPAMLVPLMKPIPLTSVQHTISVDQPLADLHRGATCIDFEVDLPSKLTSDPFFDKVSRVVGAIQPPSRSLIDGIGHRGHALVMVQMLDCCEGIAPDFTN